MQYLSADMKVLFIDTVHSYLEEKLHEKGFETTHFTSTNKSELIRIATFPNFAEPMADLAHPHLSGSCGLKLVDSGPLVLGVT